VLDGGVADVSLSYSGLPADISGTSKTSTGFAHGPSRLGAVLIEIVDEGNRRWFREQHQPFCRVFR